MKKGLKLVILLITLFIVVFQLFIFYIPLFTEPKKSDVIVILGCRLRGQTPSVFLRARTLKGADLYKQGYGRWIIVSGGRGENEDISEAEGMKRILISEGIPEEKIILEDKSYNTSQNIEYSNKIMKAKGMKTAVIVSNDFHLRRAWILSKKNGIEASFDGVFVWKYFFNEAYGAIREMPAILKDWLLK